MAFVHITRFDEIDGLDADIVRMEVSSSSVDFSCELLPDGIRYTIREATLYVRGELSNGNDFTMCLPMKFPLSTLFDGEPEKYGNVIREEYDRLSDEGVSGDTARHLIVHRVIDRIKKGLKVRARTNECG